MSPQLILLVVSSILLSAGSQVVLKQGMITPRMQETLSSGNIPAIFVTGITSPTLIGGLFCYALNALLWLFVLARVPLSSAYPFTALGIGVTVIAGLTLFNETVTLAGAMGVGLIVLGILCVATQG